MGNKWVKGIGTGFKKEQFSDRPTARQVELMKELGIVHAGKSRLTWTLAKKLITEAKKNCVKLKPGQNFTTTEGLVIHNDQKHTIWIQVLIK